MTDRRKRNPDLFAAVFVGIMGLASLSHVANKPGFETMRSIVVVQLLATGMCFGVSIASLLHFFRGDRSR